MASLTQAQSGLECGADQTATASNMYYPSSGCEEAIASAESGFESYHYRKACKDQKGLYDLPAAVEGVSVTHCWDTGRGGSAVNVDICCPEVEPGPACAEADRATANNLEQTGLSCEEAEEQAGADLANYEYRKACREQKGLLALPAAVDDAAVAHCWSNGQGDSFVNVNVCCPEVEPALSCAQEARATSNGLNYLTRGCEEAEEHATTNLTSGHYRRACMEQTSLSSRPTAVDAASVTQCWSNGQGGSIVNVDVCCPTGTVGSWTEWLNRDTPDASGDWENLSAFRAAGQACDNPIEVECQTLDGVDAAQAGQEIVCSANYGFRCVNDEQAEGTDCLDYHVRFLCP